MPIGPPRQGATRQEVADHIAKLVYNEVMACRHFKVFWRTADGVTSSNPLIIQPLAVPKTIMIELDGGAGPQPDEAKH